MKLLFSLAFKNRKLLPYCFILVISMCLLTVATQSEIVTIGLLTKKGPGFFELFGPEKEGTIQDVSAVSKAELLERFEEIDQTGSGVITKEEVSHYLDEHKKLSLVDYAMLAVSRYLPITEHPEYLAIVVLLVALFNAAAMFTYRLTSKLISINVSQDLRQRYFEHIQTLELRFYQDHNIGSLSSRVVSDALSIADGVNATLANYLQTPFTILSTLILCFLMSWKLTLFIFIGLPLIAYPIVLIARHVKRIAKLLQKNQESFASVLIDYLGGIQTVKMFGMEEFSLKKYSEENQRMAFLEKKSAKYDVSSRPIVHTIGMSMLSIALIFGLYFIGMSVPEVLVYAGLLYIFYEPIKKFAETNAIIQRGAAAAERMEEVMQVSPTILDREDADELQFQKAIELKDVSFRYGDEWVLKGINLSVEKGQTVAFVGPTGSGKSTLIQLIARLYDIQKGEIFIDGKSIENYTINSLRKNFSFVPQKPFLFLGSIRENICFGKELSNEELQTAARQAHALEFIDLLPEKFETSLAEMGKNLSGGQQQRIAIARALAHKAPILILDEATSSLDSISEQHIKTAIRDLKGSMTQIIIAHRLTTIADADKIVYLDRGQVLHQGTLEEMIEECPPFKAMWEAMLKSDDEEVREPELTHAH